MFSRLMEESGITDQWMLDRTLKRLRKLRWIGKEQEAERIRHVLRDMRLPQLREELRREEAKQESHGLREASRKCRQRPKSLQI